MGYEHVEGHLEVFHPDTGSFLADDNNRLFSYFTSGEQCNEGVKRIGTVSGRAREDNFQAYGAGFTLVVVDTSSHHPPHRIKGSSKVLWNWSKSLLQENLN